MRFGAAMKRTAHAIEPPVAGIAIRLAPIAGGLSCGLLLLSKPKHEPATTDKTVCVSVKLDTAQTGPGYLLEAFVECAGSDIGRMDFAFALDAPQ